MDNRRIARILSSCDVTKKDFLGTFSSDNIEMPTRFPASMVVNLDESSQPGSHWVAVYVKSPTEVMHFDSYAQDPEGNIKEFLKHFENVTINPFVVQSVLSNVCAAYCIYFIFKMSKGMTYPQLLFTLINKPNMDVYVRWFVNELIG